MIARRKGYLIFALIGVILPWVGLTSAAEFAIVRVSRLNVRTGPGLGYAVSTRLTKETRVRVVGFENDWINIEVDGVRGFILNKPEFVTLSDKAKPEDAQSAENKETLKNLRQQAEILNEKLEASQGELATITGEEKKVLDDFNTLEEALNQTRRQVSEARQAMKDLESRIEDIEAQSALLQQQIQSGEAYAAKRIVALYKLNWLGKLNFLAAADSFFDFYSRKDRLERILQQDEKLLTELHQNQMTLDGLLEEVNARKAEKKALELTLRERLDTLQSEQARRSELLESIRNEKRLAAAALASLEEAARELDATLRNLKPAARAGEEPAALRSAAENKAGSFDASRGLLSWPVKGKIVSFYGPYRDEKFNTTNFQSGIEIQAERGEPIRAVSDGYTIFSSWFKGFGNMLIIDHGDHYYTVYAHLEEIFKVKGDRVERDEVIATVGDSGSLTGPALHFEVRHHGKPMDPLNWIKKG